MYLYRSSRLGIQNYFNNDGNSDFIRLVGDKRYELSNHLGNVLSVITDRKLVPNEAKLLYSETFQKATDWIPDNAILLNSSGQLDITCSALDAGIKKQLAFNASTPVIFQMSVTKGTGFPAAVPLIFSVRDMSNHVVWSTIVDDSGIVSGTWTPAVSANYWIKVSVGVAAPFPLLFSIDNFYAYMLPSPPDDFSGLYLPDVVAFNDYFPFGMLVPNRHKSAPDYRYGFNGKEKDDEVKGEGNSVDFGARMLDPRVGRWFAPDPLERKFTSFSTYNFALNSPILFVDSDGKEIFIPTVQNKEHLKISKYRKLSELGRLLPANPDKILADLQKMTNDKLKLTSVKIKSKIVGYIVEVEAYDTENQNKNYEKGTGRIRNLIKGDQYSAIAKSADGKNGTAPLDGKNSVIFYNENRKGIEAENLDGFTPGVLNEDGSEGRPPFIGLGHELGHAENYKDTNLRPTEPFEEGLYLDPDNPDKNTPTQLSTDEKVAGEKDAEIRAEHLGETENGTEVKMRAQPKKNPK